jgi:hypothetical protein
MDPDQTARMRRLVWIHAGRKRIMLVLSWHGSYRYTFFVYISSQDKKNTGRGIQTPAYLERDKTPDISATPVNKKGLTEHQKEQLEMFQEMKTKQGKFYPDVGGMKFLMFLITIKISAMILNCISYLILIITIKGHYVPKMLLFLTTYYFWCLVIVDKKWLSSGKLPERCWWFLANSSVIVIKYFVWKSKYCFVYILLLFRHITTCPLLLFQMNINI